jgi:membrane-associated phospholipid phosphatase
MWRGAFSPRHAFAKASAERLCSRNSDDTRLRYRSTVRRSDWLAVGYFLTLTVLAWLRPLPLGRRLFTSALSLAMCAATWLIARYAAVRDLSPALMILVGYFASGLFFVGPTRRFESWLIEWDRRLLGDPSTRFARWPRAWLAFLDIIYMGCFLMLPAGLVALMVTGHGALVDRYWTLVMAAEFGSFLPLTVVQSRPPWVIEREPVLPDRAVHRLASEFVQHLTIRANTFPSGHAAGSLAVALGVIDVLPATGAVLLVLALCICLASVVGRYHYVVDVVAGAALAIALWVFTTPPV